MFDEQLLGTIAFYSMKQLQAAAFLLAIYCFLRGLSEVFEKVEEEWRTSVMDYPTDYFDLETGEYLLTDSDYRVVKEHFYNIQVPAFFELVKLQFFVSVFLLKASIFPWI